MAGPLRHLLINKGKRCFIFCFYAGNYWVVVVSIPFWQERAIGLASGHRKSLHSLPEHYGFYLALYLSVPAAVVFFGWYLSEAAVLEWLLKTNLPEGALPTDPAQLLFFNNVRDLNDLTLLQGKSAPALPFAVEYYQSLSRLSDLTLIVALIGFGSIGLTIGWRTLKPALRRGSKLRLLSAAP